MLITIIATAPHTVRTFACPVASIIFFTSSAWHRSSLPLSTTQEPGGKSSGQLDKKQAAAAAAGQFASMHGVTYAQSSLAASELHGSATTCPCCILILLHAVHASVDAWQAEVPGTANGQDCLPIAVLHCSCTAAAAVAVAVAAAHRFRSVQ